VSGARTARRPAFGGGVRLRPGALTERHQVTTAATSDRASERSEPDDELSLTHLMGTLGRVRPEVEGHTVIECETLVCLGAREAHD
jgi:hypothetical protein